MVRLAVSHYLKIFKTEQRPVRTSHNWSLCPKVTCKYPPVYKLFYKPEIIFFGSQLTGLWSTEIYVTYILTVTCVTLIRPHQRFTFLVHHRCLICRAPGECPCWAKLGLDDYLNHHHLDLDPHTLLKALCSRVHRLQLPPGLSPPTRDVGRFFLFLTVGVG